MSTRDASFVQPGVGDVPSGDPSGDAELAAAGKIQLAHLPVAQRRLAYAAALSLALAIAAWATLSFGDIYLVREHGLTWNPAWERALNVAFLGGLVLFVIAVMLVAILALIRASRLRWWDALAAVTAGIVSAGTAGVVMTDVASIFLGYANAHGQTYVMRGESTWNARFYALRGWFFQEIESSYTSDTFPAADAAGDGESPHGPSAGPNSGPSPASTERPTSLPAEPGTPGAASGAVEPEETAEVDGVHYEAILEDSAGGEAKYGLYVRGEGEARWRVGDLPAGGLYELYFATPGIGYASYAGGGLYASADAGASWQKLQLPYSLDWPQEARYLEDGQRVGELGAGGRVRLRMNYPHWTARGEGILFDSADGVSGWERVN